MLLALDARASSARRVGSFARRLNILAAAILCSALLACSPVSVIGPTADVNKRNVDVLRERVEQSIALNETLVSKLVDLHKINQQERLIKAVRSETSVELKAIERDEAQIPQLSRDALVANSVTRLTTAANGLAATVNALAPDARDAQREHYRYSQPLAAAVAFDGVQPQTLLVIVNMFGAIRDNGASPKDKFASYWQQLETLPVAAELNANCRALIDGVDALNVSLDETSANAQQLADALVTAAAGSASAAHVAKSAMENTEVQRSIATIVSSRASADSSRKKAADSLLKELDATKPDAD